MLEKEKYYKTLSKKLYLTLVIFAFCNFKTVFSDDKLSIINNLNNINTLEFNFTQKTVNKKKEGMCFLSFPKKLRCNYSDNKQSILIVNNNDLYIYQKRYKKTYYYPLKNSILKKILDKGELINLKETGSLSYSEKNIYLTQINDNENKTIIIFDKENFNLIGWEIYDQLNKKTSFLMKIKNINKQISLKIFNLPSSY